MKRTFIFLLALAACDAPAEQPPADPPSERPGAAIRAKLSVEARTVVDRSALPALVIDDDRLLARSKLMAKPKWYALSTQSDGITVSLHATRVAHAYPHIAPSPPPKTWQVRGKNARLTQNEGIWSAAWEEDGIAYSLEVECNRLPDPRCEDERHLMGLAARLVRVEAAR